MNWRRLILPFAALYAVAWVAFLWWMIHETRENDWLVEQHVSPDAAAIPLIIENHWHSIIARDGFMNLSPPARLAVADRVFQSVERLAQSQGWNPEELREWFRRTAEHVEQYPIRSFSLGTGDTIPYRDLRESGFPRPSRSRLFLREWLTREFLLIALVAAAFAFLPYLLIVGIVGAFRAKGLALRWKFLIGALIAVAVLEGVVMRRIGSKPVALGFYLFSDVGSYVTASGTWTSDTPLGWPEQTTRLDCWRSWGHCIEATATIDRGIGTALSVKTMYWEIVDWGEEAIVAKDEKARCTTTSLRIDRKKEIVTSTRTTNKPKASECAHWSDDPIFLHLTDGFKLRFEDR